MRARDFVLPLVLLGSLAWQQSASGQNFNDSEKRVWDKMQEALSLNDTDELSKIAKRNMTDVNGIFDKLEGEVSFADEVEKWDKLKLVQKALDSANGNNVLEIRIANLQKLSMEQRQKRVETIGKYNAARDQVEAAISAKDMTQLQNGVTALNDLAKTFFDLGDVEYRSNALIEVYRALDQAGQPADALKVLEDVSASIAQAGYKNWATVGLVAEGIKRLKEAAADPNAKPGDAPKPAGSGNNTGTTWSNDPEGQRWSDPVPMKLVIDEKLPSKFNTPSPTASENTQGWRWFTFDGNGPAEFDPQFQPLGKKLKFTRDGVKVFIDEGDSKKHEAKVISKPNLYEISAEQKNTDGQSVTGKYAVLFASGNSQESFFGLSVNMSPGPTQLTVRYSPACYLKGRLNDEEVNVFDDNSSGRFGDSFRVNEPTVDGGAEFTYDDAIIVGKEKVATPWTEYVEHGGNFYRIKLDGVDMTMRTRKLAIQTGFVKLAWSGTVKPEVLTIEETGEFKGAFFAIGDKPVRVPAGRYKLSYGIIRQGKRDQEKSCVILPGHSTALDVAPDATVTFDFGAPFTYDFKKEDQAKGVKVVGRSVTVFGKAGEMYCRFRDDTPVPDEVSMRVKGGAQVGKPQPMKRATTADYNKNNLVVWSPVDLVVAGNAPGTFEVKLETKKHPLLQAPIKSDWK